MECNFAVSASVRALEIVAGGRGVFYTLNRLSRKVISFSTVFISYRLAPTFSRFGGERECIWNIIFTTQITGGGQTIMWGGGGAEGVLGERGQKHDIYN